MDDYQNLEERISKLEHRIEFYDKIWLFASLIGLTILFLWVAIIVLRGITFIFD